MATFVNREVRDPDKWIITYADGTSENVTLTTRQTVITPGTPLDASNLNGSFDECVKTVYTGGLKMLPLTQAEYDALTEKDENTFYIITD